MKIQSTRQLAAMIRSQMSSARKASQSQGEPSDNAKKGNLRAKKSQAPAQKNVGSLIVQKVAEIPLEDPNRRRKTFRVFLESVLLDELGDVLVADPRFFQMVDHIQDQMEADEEIAPVIEQAINLLLVPTE
ncbi:hypothetical protein ACO0LM_26180 [Undibacterium sp. Di26W]|uniref:hypothetical protein n=1 Tax=Undibacterium sp. Di26W TaxID=3413035 RepID=UPI003BF1F2BD